jgi:hypothetical protein
MINTILSILSAIASIGAVIVAWKQLSKGNKDRLEEIERTKRQATLDAYNRLQEQALDQLNLWTPTQCREMSKDSIDYKRIGSCLARVEHFCVGLNQDIYDYDTFYELAHGYFDKGGTLYNRLVAAMQPRLSRAGEDYFANIHKAWDRMEKGSDASLPNNSSKPYLPNQLRNPCGRSQRHNKNNRNNN